MQTADDIIALPERLVQPLDKGQRMFRIALVLAFLLHIAFLIEVGRSKPRSIGDRSGAPDAIAVDLVTEADLKSREAVAMPPMGAPTPPAAEPPTPEPEAQPQPTPEPQPQPQPEAATPPAPKEPPVEEKKQEQASLPDFESTIQELATTPLPKPVETPPAPEEAKPEEKKQEAAKPAEKQTPPAQPAKKKPQQQARIDPNEFQNAPPGRSTGATRPPGITRSGENDDFGRAVVRALRQTMPAPRGIFGRVTVKLILTENGDLGSVQVLERSGTSLDQDVVFATKQTYFPLPPYKSTVVDRTFLITYVYR